MRSPWTTGRAQVFVDQLEVVAESIASKECYHRYLALKGSAIYTTMTKADRCSFEAILQAGEEIQANGALDLGRLKKLKSALRVVTDSFEGSMSRGLFSLPVINKLYTHLKDQRVVRSNKLQQDLGAFYDRGRHKGRTDVVQTVEEALDELQQAPFGAYRVWQDEEGRIGYLQKRALETLSKGSARYFSNIDGLLDKVLELNSHQKALEYLEEKELYHPIALFDHQIQADMQKARIWGFKIYRRKNSHYQKHTSLVLCQLLPGFQEPLLVTKGVTDETLYDMVDQAQSRTWKPFLERLRAHSLYKPELFLSAGDPPPRSVDAMKHGDYLLVKDRKERGRVNFLCKLQTQEYGTAVFLEAFLVSKGEDPVRVLEAYLDRLRRIHEEKFKTIQESQRSETHVVQPRVVKLPSLIGSILKVFGIGSAEPVKEERLLLPEKSHEVSELEKAKADFLKLIDPSCEADEISYSEMFEKRKSWLRKRILDHDTQQKVNLTWDRFKECFAKVPGFAGKDFSSELALALDERYFQ